jgi:transcriptional regulator with GAF, ATPase, and Fis domain
MNEYTVLTVSESRDPETSRINLSRFLDSSPCRIQIVASQAEACLLLLNRSDIPIPDFLLIESHYANECDIDPLLIRTLERVAPTFCLLEKLLPNEKVILLVALSPHAQAHQETLTSTPPNCSCRHFHNLSETSSSRFLKIEKPPLRHDLGSGYVFLASSSIMKRLYRKALTLAEVDVPVLLLGESGTGKEVVARLIHNCSPRRDRPMMRINCAALPAELLESELFGFEAGAFTGALKTKPGKFELCDGGTLFLDEIGEMSTALQAKLLHVLQDGEYSRLGGRTSRHANVRIIAATNIDKERAIQERSFRADLYYRLSAFILNIPPLRERKDDLYLLIEHYRHSFAEQLHLPAFDFDHEMLLAAQDYGWPGNVRELMNFIQRTTIFREREAALEELGPRNLHLVSYSKPAPAAEPTNVAEMKVFVSEARVQIERDMIVKTLHETGWNRRHAADRLKISDKTLLCKMKEYHVQAARLAILFVCIFINISPDLGSRT